MIAAFAGCGWLDVASFQTPGKLRLERVSSGEPSTQMGAQQTGERGRSHFHANESTLP